MEKSKKVYLERDVIPWHCPFDLCLQPRYCFPTFSNIDIDRYLHNIIYVMNDFNIRNANVSLQNKKTHRKYSFSAWSDTWRWPCSDVSNFFLMLWFSIKKFSLFFYIYIFVCFRRRENLSDIWLVWSRPILIV